MTDAEVAELKKLVEKATPAEWRVRPTDDDCVAQINGPDWSGFATVIVGFKDRDGYDPTGSANAAFIAAARTALPRLIEERERLREALAECRDNLVDQIEADIDFCCPHDSNGNAVIEEMDEELRPMIEATQALLAKVSAALSGEPKADEQ